MTMTDDWKLDEIVRVPGVRHALVLSSDGLFTHRSASLHTDSAETLAAAGAGIVSLARGVAGLVGTGEDAPLHMVMTEYEGGMLLARAAGDLAHLLVVAEPDADPGLVNQHMMELVGKIGRRNLTTPARAQT